jgi:GT2 family glycosyltransferase
MLQKPKWFTAIIPVILTNNIDRCLETLYRYTEEDTFYVYIIDQSIRGLDATALRNKYRNLMVIRTPKSNTHYTGNLGFAQATNLGITLVQTPYFMMLNDDVEMVNSSWWQGVLDTFQQVQEATPDSPAVIVCPASIRLADWSVGRADGDDFDILPYKEEYTQEDYNFLLNEKHYVNEHLTIEPGSVFDGVTMYACVCDTRRFLEVGLLDERYYPGTGEDYDWSCKSRMFNYRCVATTKSWVWHHWSSTFKAIRAEKEEAKSLQIPELNWNQNHEKWGDRFDIWGIRCTQCNEIMMTKDGKIATCPKHPEEVYTMPESTIMPL